MALEGAFEEVVQQLVALLVSHWVGPGLGYLGQLYVDRFLFFRLGLLLFQEFDWQALSHTKRGFSVDVLKLWRLADLLALAEKLEFALPKLLLKGELAANPEFANDDEIQEGVIHPEELAVLVHELVQPQNLFSDFVAQRLVLRPPHLLVSQQISVELLEHREQVPPELKQVLVHFGPEEDVGASQRLHLLMAGMATVLPEGACEAVIHDVGDDFVLLVELSLLGFQEVRPGFGLGDLLQYVGQS